MRDLSEYNFTTTCPICGIGLSFYDGILPHKTRCAEKFFIVYMEEKELKTMTQEEYLDHRVMFGISNEQALEEWEHDCIVIK